MPTKTFTLEEAYGSPSQDFPELVPAKRSSTESTVSKENFFPGSEEDSPLPKDSGLAAIIKAAADKYNVPEEFAFALAQQESNYDPTVENEIGAKGLYQYIDATSQALGIDPFDPAQSADAAMKDFAQQAKRKGIDWAIKHHFAGPNTKLHGPKTQEYLASVRARAEKIAKYLGKEGLPSTLIGQEVPDEENPQTLTKVQPGEVFSIEDAYGPVVGAQIKAEPKTAGFQFGEDVVDPIVTAGKNLFSSIADRIKNPPQRVERTPEEIDFLVEQEFAKLPKTIFRDDPEEIEREKNVLRDRFRFTGPMAGEEETAEFESRQAARQAEEVAKFERARSMPPWQQFLETLENPVKLILNDSLPANIASIVHNAPVKERQKYNQLKQTLQRRKILDNPSDFPAEVVAAARQKDKELSEKQSTTVRQQWNALMDSASENPGVFAGQLVNSLVADPEMLAAPIGFGLKPIQGARAALTGAKTSSRVIKLADRILDTGALGASLNLTIDAADQLATSTHLNADELAFSAGAGALFGGALGGILSRGAHAKIKNLDGARANGNLESILRDQAAYDVEVENMARGEFDPRVTTEAQQRINNMLGITSKTDRDAWIQQRRKEVRETFKNESDYADYLAFKAEERIARTEQLAAERAEREAATAAKQQASDAAGSAELSPPQTPSGPSPGEVFRALRKPAHLRTAEDLLLIKSIPKGQRGEVDPKILARLAAGGSFAAAGYAMAPEDRKLQTAFVAGLSGLMVPGGGSVLRRMSQSGATTIDGDIVSIARLVKDGKLKIERDAAEQMIKEKALIERAKSGDQRAYAELYEENFPRISRYINKQIKGVAGRLGITSDDVAQEVFIDVFNQLDKFSGDVPFSAYLTRVARNKAVDAIRDAQTLKGGKDVVTKSMYAPERGLGDDAAAGHIAEGDSSLVTKEAEAAAADEFDTPEMQAVRRDAETQIINLIQKLPEKQRQAILLNRVEQYSTEEVAKMMGESPENARKLISRAQDFIMEGLEKGYGAKKISAAKPVVESVSDFSIKRGRGRPRKIVEDIPYLPNTKILGSDGKPLKVYHGTGDFPIEKFSLDHLGSTTDAPSAKQGIFFADDLEFADAFAWHANKGNGEKSGVHEAYLDISNPIEIDAKNLSDTEVADLLIKAKQAGHDGAIIKGYHYQEGFNQTEYVVFSPDQIVRKLNNKYQRGAVDPRILKAGAVAALGAGAYGFLDTENKKLVGTIAALGGLAMLSRGRGGDTLAKGLVGTIDKGLGVVSTRLMNISRPLWYRTIEHYRAVLRDTHKYMKESDPFLVNLQHLPKEQRDFVTRAILTGNPGVAQRMIEALDNPELLQGWKRVRGVLDSLGDQLVHLKRFKNKELDYFPRIVTDYPGLLKALGNEKGDFLNKIVDDANKNSIRTRGTELTELERSLIINKALLSEPKLGGQPGFAKNRTVKEITPELQKFYASPTESLHSYIRSAVEDIERAKFFGKDLEVVEKAGKQYTNVDKSVGKMVDGLLRSGKIDEKQAMELSSMLKSLFLNGEKPSNEIIQKAKNLSYAGLLGNPVSATSQLGDAIIQTYIQGLRPAISGVVRTLTGRKYVNMKEFGLADHLAEEFVNTEGTAKFLKKVFKVGLFAPLDTFGKNVGLNAAISKAARLARTEGGIAQLHSKYGDVLQPQEFKQLVNDLQKGEVTDLVRSVAFAELSRTQPITRMEMPQAYLDNPNGRLLYQFKTFMLKQMDVVRRDAYNEIKKGNVAKGIKNLIAFTTVLGISGATTAQIQNWLRGRDSELKASDIPMNMLKTFGMSEYVLDHMLGVSKEEAQRRRDEGDTGARPTKAEPLQTIGGIITPPFKMFDEIITGDPNALRYIPVIGPILLENYKKRKAEEAL